jgi:hypothetical protein
LVGSGRGLIVRYHPGIRLEALRKPKKNFNQYSPSPGPPENEGVLTTRPGHSVRYTVARAFSQEGSVLSISCSNGEFLLHCLNFVVVTIVFRRDLPSPAATRE